MLNRVLQCAACTAAAVVVLAAGQCSQPIAAADASDEPDSPFASYYGFRKLELYKLQTRSINMLAADMNQDGRTDLILIDNSNSRLDLLQQRDKPAPPAVKTTKVNAIADDWRFEHRKIGVDHAVAALAVGDFNSDGRKDLAYLAAPDQLHVRLQGGTGDWGAARKFRIAEVHLAQWSVVAGDLNHDGKDDLVVLGKHAIALIYQLPDGELAPPQKLMNTTENLGLAQIADLDGDGLNDLCYLASDDHERPFCARMQAADGRLGPEIRCELPRPRGVTLFNIDGKPGHEVLAIEAQTGRVKIHQLHRPEAVPGELAGQVIQYGFGQQGVGRNRDLAVGDVSGDGLADVVVTDPESAQMLVFVQMRGAGLDQGTAFPGLVGAEQVRIGDFDGDKTNEVVVLSSREKTIGICKMESGRLTFPQTVAIDKEPAAIELADLTGDGRPEIVFLGKERTAQSSKYTLQAVARGDDGAWRPQLLGGAAALAVNLKGAPERLMALDANHDGAMDFLIFLGGERAPVLWLGSAQGQFTEAAGEGGFGLGNLASGALFVGLLDKPVILVSQNNFARNVEYGPTGQWRVLDQYNAADADAKIVGAATLDLDSQPGREIVLVDQGVKKLRVLRREANVFKPWREVDIGAFPYKSTHVADLNGDQRDDLLLFGAGKLGVLYAGQTDPRLKSIASYETRLENVHFNDLAAGDLNGDGLPDVAVIDTQSQYVDILNYSAQGGLRHALYFKVFEAKSLAGAEQAGSEPREALIADVTGDGLADLILLSHDRVLVYPQDDGKPPGE